MKSLIDRLASLFSVKISGLEAALDLDRIYVENVRALLKINAAGARELCERAVHQEVLEKRIGIQCDHCRRIVRVVRPGERTPSTLVCGLCEDDCEWRASLPCGTVSGNVSIVFYQMKEAADEKCSIR